MKILAELTTWQLMTLTRSTTSTNKEVVWPGWQPLVHNKDLKRLHLGFRWWFDIVGNDTPRVYPLKFRRMYNNHPK